MLNTVFSYMNLLAPLTSLDEDLQKVPLPPNKSGEYKGKSLLGCGAATLEYLPQGSPPGSIIALPYISVQLYL